MKSTTQIQTTLLNNGGKILDNISVKQIQNYSFIKSSLLEEDVSASQDFKEQFAQLHNFSRRRIKPNVSQAFFELLEKQKNKSDLTLKKISKDLFGIRPKQFKSIHFSIVTRLMHTVNENYPVYDRNVEELFDYKPPNDNKMPVFRQQNEFGKFYSNLIDTYSELLATGNLYNLLRALELKFKSYKHALNQSKSLDLLVRSAGDLKKKGKLVLPSQLILS